MPREEMEVTAKFLENLDKNHIDCWSTPVSTPNAFRSEARRCALQASRG